MIFIGIFWTTDKPEVRWRVCQKGVGKEVYVPSQPFVCFVTRYDGRQRCCTSASTYIFYHHNHEALLLKLSHSFLSRNPGVSLSLSETATRWSHDALDVTSVWGQQYRQRNEVKTHSAYWANAIENSLPLIHRRIVVLTDNSWLSKGSLNWPFVQRRLSVTAPFVWARSYRPSTKVIE